jgi:hypothetical protein
VKTCTENATARVAGDADEESCWLFIWSICPAVLSGIVPVCTPAVAAFRPVIRSKKRHLDAGLKMPPGTSIVPI